MHALVRTVFHRLQFLDPEKEEQKAFEEAHGEAMPAVGSYGLVPFKVRTPLQTTTGWR